MKKTLSKIAFAALAAFFAASFTGCPNPNGPDKPSKDAIWEDATLVEELAGKEIS